MIIPDSCCSDRALWRRLGQAKQELLRAVNGKDSLVSREWLKSVLETRVYELENQIVIRIGVKRE